MSELKGSSRPCLGHTPRRDSRCVLETFPYCIVYKNETGQATAVHLTSMAEIFGLEMLLYYWE